MEHASKTGRAIHDLTRCRDLAGSQRSRHLPNSHRPTLGPSPQISVSHSLFGSAVTVSDGQVSVSNESALATPAMDTLARHAVFGDSEEKD